MYEKHISICSMKCTNVQMMICVLKKEYDQMQCFVSNGLFRVKINDDFIY